MFQIVSQIEPDSKWPLLTLARLCESLAQHQGLGLPPSTPIGESSPSNADEPTPDGVSGQGSAASDTADKRSEIASRGAVSVREPGGATEPGEIEAGDGDCGYAAEARSIYRQLVDVDPLRRGYYADAAKGEANVVLHALGTA